MRETETKIRKSHEYRMILMKDIVKAEINNFEYHKKKLREYHLPTDQLGIVNRIKNDPLRSTKNHLLSLNSMCCLAAEYGGMDSLTSHYQAEKYAILIEEADSIVKLFELSDEYLYQYLHPKNRPIKNEVLSLPDKINLYIEREFMNDITVQSIANDFYLSREHISRVYKKSFNITVNNKIMQMRILEAKNFLTETQMTITEIALTVGFSTSQYFSKVFKI